MEASASKTSMSLFDVFLRLRPPHTSSSDERFLDLDESSNDYSTHITIKPPTNDFRKRAVEKFAFTRVFEDTATQLDVFDGAHILSLVEEVLGQEGKDGKDSLVATLGVTGSGKVNIHTNKASNYMLRNIVESHHSRLKDAKGLDTAYS